MKRFFCIACCLVLLTGCGAPAAPETTAPVTVPTTAAPTTLPTTTPSTEPPISWDENIHSGLRADGTFNEGTVFVGDSLTFGLICQYLMPQELLGDAWMMAKVGIPLNGFFLQSFLLEAEDSVFSPVFWKQSFRDSLKMVGETATAVYVMLGTNYDAYNNSSRYIELVDFMLETCPNATVYLQLIPPSTSEHVHVDEVNMAILTAHSHFYLEGIQRVMVIDTHAAIGENLLPDGVHLNDEGQRLWYEKIVAFAEENQIPE